MFITASPPLRAYYIVIICFYMSSHKIECPPKQYQESGKCPRYKWNNSLIASDLKTKWLIFPLTLFKLIIIMGRKKISIHSSVQYKIRFFAFKYYDTTLLWVHRNNHSQIWTWLTLKCFSFPKIRVR